jgi:hypothetical protein
LECAVQPVASIAVTSEGFPVSSNTLMCKLIATIFLSLSMMGCASYRAPKDKNVATLTSSVKILGITSVDGHSVCSVIRVEGVREVRLSPGKHRVHVIVLLGGYYAEGDLWFIAAPWGDYELHYSRKKMRVAFWIEELSIETGRFSQGLPRGCLRPILYVTA